MASKKNQTKPNFIKKFSETNVSGEKKFISAVVTSNITYNPKTTAGKRSLRSIIYLYAFFIFALTILSLGVLAFDIEYQQKHQVVFAIAEIVVFAGLTIDLILRWYTSEVRMKKGNWSYFLFPFSLNGLILIISLLPSLYVINVFQNNGEASRVFKVLEQMKFLRIFRLLLLTSLVPGISLFRKVLSKERLTLLIVFSIVVITILLFALVIFNIEHSTNALNSYNLRHPNDKILTLKELPIKDFLDALYFSTVSLTTIGFGDITPITSTGKIVVMVMSVIGIAVLAIPSGIIAGGFISEIKEYKKKRNEEVEAKK